MQGTPSSYDNLGQMKTGSWNYGMYTRTIFAEQTETPTFVKPRGLLPNVHCVLSLRSVFTQFYFGDFTKKKKVKDKKKTFEAVQALRIESL